MYHGRAGQLEYDFVLQPGADPARIRLGFEGASPRLGAAGDLVLGGPAGEVLFHRPVLYQEIGDRRAAVDGAFVLADNHEIHFTVGAHDPHRAVVIDPTLLYATFLGGTGDDQIQGIAVDGAGSAIVIGYTYGTDFPTTAGALKTTLGALNHLTPFVTKFSPDGGSLVFSTYFTGTTGDDGAVDQGFATTVDAQDNIYVAGRTQASDFPTTAGAFQTQLGTYGSGDGFIAKLTPTGTLTYSTYLGGYAEDAATGVAVDAQGNAYVTGTTYSLFNPDFPIPFPTTPSAFLAPFASPANYGVAFFAKLNPTGTQLLYSTLLGQTPCTDTSTCPGYNCGTGSNSIAIDPSGKAYIGGATCQPGFPVTAGALQTTPPTILGANDQNVGFVAAFDPTKTGAASLIYASYLGGHTEGAGDHVFAVAADADGNLYATGFASRPDFPTTPGAYSAHPAFYAEGTILSKIDPTGAHLIFSSVIQNHSPGLAIALDSMRNIYIAGASGQFPTVNPIQQVTDGADAFVAMLSADGSQLLFSTYLGDELSNYEITPYKNGGLALDRAGNIYVAGSTADPYTSGAGHFPVTAGAYQPARAGTGDYDGFVAKISAVVVPPPDAGASDATDASDDIGSETGGADTSGAEDAGEDAAGDVSGTDAGSPSDSGGTDGGKTTPNNSGCSYGLASKATDQHELALASALLLLAFVRRRGR